MEIDLNSVGTIAIVIAIIIAVVAGTLIYIAVNGPKKAKKTALLYSEWHEQLELPGLTKNATLNTKAIEKFFKVVWPKKFPEELDVRQEIDGLKQETVLEFAQAANEQLQPKDSTQVLIYDLDDAAEGFIRLYAVEQDSIEYKAYLLQQELLMLIKSHAPIKEFTRIDIPNETDFSNWSSLESFIITGDDFPRNDEAAVENLLHSLTMKFKDIWLLEEIGSNAILLRKQTEADLRSKEDTPVEANPFQARLEAKRQAEEEARAEEVRAREARREAWEAAERERQAKEISQREEAISQGTVSRFVDNPLAFLSAELAVAADEADLLTLDDEPEILKVDGIGSPILFCVYSEKLLKEDEKKVEVFASTLIEALEKNLSGKWGVEYAEDSMTFRKGL